MQPNYRSDVNHRGGATRLYLYLPPKLSYVTQKLKKCRHYAVLPIMTRNALVLRPLIFYALDLFDNIEHKSSKVIRNLRNNNETKAIRVAGVRHSSQHTIPVCRKGKNDYVLLVWSTKDVKAGVKQKKWLPLKWIQLYKWCK